jgi:D-xylose 1-dehydrogenase
MTTLACHPILQDRTVVITGGATGIGACLVEQFALQGAKVGFIDIAADAGQALARGLASARHAPLFVTADLTDIAALEAALATIRARFGPVTVLLNNAANDQRHAIAATTPQIWDDCMAVNLRHQFFAARAVIDDMRQSGGGSIVNFGSVSWMLKSAGMPAYTAAKAAVQGLTRTLARELGPYRIRVNTLVPGWVMTDRQVRLWLDEAGRAARDQGQCLPGDVMPIHIAAMALFLAADDSAMCTAQDFIVDGGWV